jgi:hypothetical protein
MGKRRGRHPGSRKAAVNGLIRERFSCFIDAVGAVNTTGFHGGHYDLYPSALGTRMAELNAIFKKWRFCGPLHVKAFMDTSCTNFWAVDNSTPSDNTVGTQNAYFASGFYGAPSATSATNGPTTIGDIVELIAADVSPSWVPIKYSVPLKVLREAQMSPWQLCFSTSDTVLYTADNVIGSLWTGMQFGQGWASGYAPIAFTKISGEIEFAEPVSSTSTMSRPQPALSPPVVSESKENDGRSRHVRPSKLLRSELRKGRLNDEEEKMLALLMHKNWGSSPDGSRDATSVLSTEE